MEKLKWKKRCQTSVLQWSGFGREGNAGERGNVIFPKKKSTSRSGGMGGRKNYNTGKCFHRKTKRKKNDMKKMSHKPETHKIYVREYYWKVFRKLNDKTMTLDVIWNFNRFSCLEANHSIPPPSASATATASVEQQHTAYPFKNENNSISFVFLGYYYYYFYFTWQEEGNSF